LRPLAGPSPLLCCYAPPAALDCSGYGCSASRCLEIVFLIPPPFIWRSLSPFPLLQVCLSLPVHQAFAAALIKRCFFPLGLTDLRPLPSFKFAFSYPPSLSRWQTLPFSRAGKVCGSGFAWRLSVSPASPPDFPLKFRFTPLSFYPSSFWLGVPRFKHLISYIELAGHFSARFLFLLLLSPS